ncbi:unnamed protein product [Rotaria magnacalcarata]|uniref:Uncharacterized protein n=3 Tax=Rotaria magnacalcarata TaxID=392030 RepID=A0A819BLU4_9BILA|nr:unnamed protein product [Rotaria magnacalcarata]CAF3800314.1 unnamed protein product [Rotaria magnacalcarata]
MASKESKGLEQSLIKSTNKIDNHLIPNVRKFRIPKIARPANDIQLSDQKKLADNFNKMETDEIVSLKISNVTANSLITNQLKDRFNFQQRKRKFSNTKYKKCKQLKLNNSIDTSSADVDMRINGMENFQNFRPASADKDSTIQLENQSIGIQSTISDTMIKSNLSEPGVRKLIKKKLIWADENSQVLEQISFFETDNAELAEMHGSRHLCTTDLSIVQPKKFFEDDLHQRQSFPPLPTLIRILLPDTIRIPAARSQESPQQEKCEKNALSALSIPAFLLDRPSEPNGDLLGYSTMERKEPKLIPLDSDASLFVPNELPLAKYDNDDSFSTNLSLPSTTTKFQIPSIHSSLSCDSSISPEVARILAHAKENLPSAASNTSSSILQNEPNITNTLPTDTIANLALNFDLAMATSLYFNQLLINFHDFGAKSTTLNNTNFQPPLATSTTLPSTSMTTALNFKHNSFPNQQSSMFSNKETSK